MICGTWSEATGDYKPTHPSVRTGIVMTIYSMVKNGPWTWAMVILDMEDLQIDDNLFV